MAKTLLALAFPLIACAAPPRQAVTDLHYEPDHGCGGGYVITICDLYPDGLPRDCWTGDVRDLPRRER